MDIKTKTIGVSINLIEITLTIPEARDLMELLKENEGTLENRLEDSMQDLLNELTETL